MYVCMICLFLFNRFECGSQNIAALNKYGTDKLISSMIGDKLESQFNVSILLFFAFVR